MDHQFLFPVEETITLLMTFSMAIQYFTCDTQKGKRMRRAILQAVVSARLTAANQGFTSYITLAFLKAWFPKQNFLEHQFICLPR